MCVLDCLSNYKTMDNNGNGNANDGHEMPKPPKTAFMLFVLNHIKPNNPGLKSYINRILDWNWNNITCERLYIKTIGPHMNIATWTKKGKSHGKLSIRLHGMNWHSRKESNTKER